MYRKYKRPWSIRFHKDTDMHKLVLFLEMCGYNVSSGMYKGHDPLHRNISYEWNIVKFTFSLEAIAFKSVDDLIARHMKLSEKSEKNAKV